MQIFNFWAKYSIFMCVLPKGVTKTHNRKTYVFAIHLHANDILGAWECKLLKSGTHAYYVFSLGWPYCAVHTGHVLARILILPKTSKVVWPITCRYCTWSTNRGAACKKVRSTENDQSDANMRTCWFISC